MIVSYAWLQTYFKKKLPRFEEAVDLFTFHAFEVESVEKKEDDVLIDVKVLPDRAHYALSHRGVARELAAAMKTEAVIPDVPMVSVAQVPDLSISIADAEDCARYIGRRVEGVTMTASPAWLAERLAAIGQRSINPVVDAANYVMFDMGQPLHAFDADKVVGSVVIRRAQKGEQIRTLDGKDVVLDPSMLVIADEIGPLGIAGIKGGTRAAVTDTTTRLILEAAHFNPVLLRKTSFAIGIRTDASKRFENGLPFVSPEIAMAEFSALLQMLLPGVSFGELVDVHETPPPAISFTISATDVAKRLGVSLTAQEVKDTLAYLAVSVAGEGDHLTIAPPAYRLDITRLEDVVEEVGRLKGYDSITENVPQVVAPPAPHKALYWEYNIRNFLLSQGYSEVYTSSFNEQGEREIEKPLAEDKRYLRADLLSGMRRSLSFNSTMMPLLGIDEVKIFEIGKIFTAKGEEHHLCVGIAGVKSKKEKSVNERIRELRDAFVSYLGAPLSTVCTVDDTGGIILLSGNAIGTINKEDGILECNLDALFAALPEPTTWDIHLPQKSATRFVPFSLYPFIARDIAVLVPRDVTADDVWGVMSPVTGPLLKTHRLFDVFEKKDKEGGVKMSYAFRLIFQAMDRTLTDEEVNGYMQHVSDAVHQHDGWQVR